MTSRERVWRCVEFQRPDRVPRDLWMLPIIRLQNGDRAVDEFVARWPVDFAGAPVCGTQQSPIAKGDPYTIGECVDAWGCTWTSIQAGVIGEVKKPPIAEWSDMDKFRPPLEALEFDHAAVDRFCESSDKFVFAGNCPAPFERLQFLRGPENLYCDIAEESAEFIALLHGVRDFYVTEMEAWARTKVDALRFNDDWGAQRALLIAPSQWQKLFKPIYAEFARIAHDAGKKIFMHSDGHIFDIYGDLIEIGIDAINSQLFCMDIEEIGRQCKGKITFWGEIDRQHILPNGTRDEARAAVRRVVENLYDPRGGVIAQFELGAAAKIENADAIFRAWEELP